MKIGIDFDNTIVNYDRVFYKTALDLNLIPDEINKSKIAVRDFLRSRNKNEIWTDLQGFVYGKKMYEADIFEGFINFLNFAHDSAHEVVIISHKTKYPYAGKKYDLHKAAEQWIEDNLSQSQINLSPSNKYFFLPTKEEKVNKIVEEKCDIFIDDLPEIFELENFPKFTKQILFDPLSSLKDYKEYTRVESWKEIEDFFIKDAR